MPKIKYTREDKNRAVKLYSTGLSCLKIRNITGIHEASIRAWVRKAGIIRKKNVMRLSREKVEEILTYYVKERKSRRQIQTMTGIDQYVIYRVLKKEGVIRKRSQAISIRQRGKTRKMPEVQP